MEEASAGIDWASEEHALCVVDMDGRALAGEMHAHDEAGIEGLIARMRGLGVVRVAIERPDGLLVDRLLEAGFTVLPVHPNKLKATRPRYEAAGGKSDGFDAFVLAELARTDSHRLHALRPHSDETRALRVLTRSREDLVGARVRLANELRAQLEAFWPGAALVFSAVDSKISLAFLERYPSPADARGLGEKRLAAFLARNGYSGKRSAGELLGRLQVAPQGRAGEVETQARRAAVLGFVAALRPIVERIAELNSQIGEAVRAHPDSQVFLPLFKDPKSVVTAARLVAEIGDDRSRSTRAPRRWRQTPAWRRLRGSRASARSPAFAGPATSACAPPWPAWPTPLAITIPGRGLDHSHAIRVLWRCWQDGVPYDPGKHGNLGRLQVAGG